LSEADVLAANYLTAPDIGVAYTNLDYVWGDIYDPAAGWKANSWQGTFPVEDSADDGFHGIAPVASFEAIPTAFATWPAMSGSWSPTGTSRSTRASRKRTRTGRRESSPPAR
jgi:hypothetical protein